MPAFRSVVSRTVEGAGGRFSTTLKWRPAGGRCSVANPGRRARPHRNTCQLHGSPASGRTPPERVRRIRRAGALGWSPWSHRVWVWTACRTTRAQCSRDPNWLAGDSTMTEGSRPKDAPHPFTDEARALGINVDDPRALAWMEAHLPEFRQQASGQRPLYWILGIGFVVAWPPMSAATCSDRRHRPSRLAWWPTCCMRSGSHSGPVSSWCSSSRSGRRPNGASSSGRWMPTRQRCASRAEPEAARRRGTTERRRRGSGQAERPAGWCDTSWSMTSHWFRFATGDPRGGHIEATSGPRTAGSQRTPAVTIGPASCQLTSGAARCPAGVGHQRPNAAGKRPATRLDSRPVTRCTFGHDARSFLLCTGMTVRPMAEAQDSGDVERARVHTSPPVGRR
jgi:hypothetical protein